MRQAIALILSIVANVSSAEPVQVTDGKVFDRLASVQIQGQLVLGVFERTTAPGSGYESDLHLLRSTDGGTSFANPLLPLLPSSAARRHPSLIRDSTFWQLYFEEGLVNNTVVLRRALSSDGLEIVPQPAIDLGWADGPHRRPHVVPGQHGALLLSYERDDNAYLALSTDQGVSFDTLRTQTASNANFARIAIWGNRYVLVYQNTAQLSQVGIKISADLRDWSAPTTWLTLPDRDSFHPFPVALADGSLVVYYATIAPNQQRPNLYSRGTLDGIDFSGERQETLGNFSKAQPFVYARNEAGRVGLFYSQSSSPCGSSYCYLYWDRDRPAGEETLLAAGFETR